MTGKVRRWLFVVLSLGLLLVVLAVGLRQMAEDEGYETHDAVLERVIKKELAREKSFHTDVRIFNSVTLGNCYLTAYQTATEPPKFGIMPFILYKSLDSVTVKVRGVYDNTMIYGGQDKGDGIWEHGLAFCREGELYQYAIFLSDNPQLAYVEWVVDGAVYHLPVEGNPSMTVVQWAPYPREELAQFEALGYGVEASLLPEEEMPSGGMGSSEGSGLEERHDYTFSFYTAEGEPLGMAKPPAEEAT